MVLSALHLSISRRDNKMWDEELFPVLLKFENNPIHVLPSIKTF